MKQRFLIAVVLLAVLIGAGILWYIFLRVQKLPTSSVSETAPDSAVFSSSKVTALTPTSRIPKTVRQEPGGPYQPLDPRWPARRLLRNQDPSYEWRTPISFYGKVLDQDGQPVEDVLVRMNWTDTSKEGTSRAERKTSENGDFSITEIHGKSLGILSLEKEGYLPAKKTNPHSFEYGGFWEPDYHEPDPNNPVIFYLKRKGQPAPLVKSEGKMVISLGTPFSIPIPNQVEGQWQIKGTVFQNDRKSKTWRAEISVPGGGIQPALEEFPFVAPVEGYQPSMELTQDSVQPVGWPPIDEGGRFFVKTTQGYGLLELRQMKGKKTLFYKIIINTDGGTNLESDS